MCRACQTRSSCLHNCLRSSAVGLQGPDWRSEMRASGRFGWGFGLAAALLAVAIAMVAYNVGVSDGAAAGATATEAVRRVQWSGHGGVFLWPLLWVAFFAFFWRGACWRRHYWYG